MSPTIKKQKSKKGIEFSILVLFLFMAALTVRLYDLKDAPLEFHSTRQLHSALMARGIYYAIKDDLSVPDWQRETAIRQWKLEGLIEPPIMEWITAFTYKSMGAMNLWVARVYAIGFWILAGIALFLIAEKIIGPIGALVAEGFFLFYPYGIIASRSFQPEALLIACLSLYAYAAVNWYGSKTWGWATAVGFLGGLAILIKTVAIFFILGMWLGLIFSNNSLQQALRNRQLWLAAVLTIIPYGVFHYYGMYVVGGLASQFSLRFFPQFLTQSAFYLRWLSSLRKAVGLEWLLISLVGFLLIKKKSYRWMLFGAWLGYLSLGVTLPHHISTHDYYHLPVYLMVAIGSGAIAAMISRKILDFTKWGQTFALFILLFGITIYSYDAYSTLKKVDYYAEEAFWQEMGTLLGHDAKVIALSEDYGNRLAYWGWLTPTNWMTVDDIQLRKDAGLDFNFQTVFDESTAGKDYFLITLFDELERQPELKKLLYSNYQISKEGKRFVLFDLRRPLRTGDEP
ncbi:MAG TPA: glycosyltransferase family 39 protein [Anaerolineae bacterium]|nr:glycosyltransferase family 39 protein [Anaerolineae bacterium]